jgi:hypothetical protein
MLSKEDAEKILNYGQISYENGFRDGYKVGVITGCLTTIIGTVSLVLISKTLFR